MFKRVREAEEEKTQKRQCIQHELDALAPRKQELKEERDKLAQLEKDIQSRLGQVQPMNPNIVELMDILELGPETRGQFDIFKIAESSVPWDESKLQDVLPPELHDKCKIYQRKFGPWVFTCEHSDKCAACRYDEPNIVDVEYTGEDVSIACTWFDGKQVTYDISFEDIAVPSPDNLKWELVDFDQSVADACVYALFVIYRQ